MAVDLLPDWDPNAPAETESGMLRQALNQEQAPQEEEMSLRKQLMQNAPINFLAAAGEQFGNNAINIANLIPGVNLDKLSGLSEPGLSQTLGHFGGDLAALLTAGGIAGKAIPALGGALPTTLGGKIATRGIGAGAWGGIQNPENPELGAKTGLLAQGAAELLPGALRGIGRAAEHIIPQKATNEIISKIKAGAEATEKEITDNYFAPTINKFKNHRMASTQLIKDLETPRYAKHYSPKAEDLLEEFKSPTINGVKNPHYRTLDAAHELQSQLTKDLASNKGVGGVSHREAQAASYAQKKLLEAISDALDKRQSGLGDLYKEGRQKWAAELIPYKNGKVLGDISSGARDISGIPLSPQQLHTGLKNESMRLSGIEANQLKRNPQANVYKHPIRGFEEELRKKLESGQALRHIPGSQWASSMAQNPQVQNIASKVEPGYDMLTKALLAQLLGGR